MHPAPRIRFGVIHRRRGELDVADLSVGIGLLILVPFVVYFIGAFFIETHYEPTMGEKPEVDAPPDQDEVRLHLLEAVDLLKKNAPRYLELMKVTTDRVLRDKYRQWAERALTEGLSKLDEVEFLIEKHPEGPTAFGSDLQRVARMRAEGKAELKRVKELDVLGS